MSSILFAKHVSFEHSVSSPRPVITSRREEKNNKAKVFQHPIDSHSQSASSRLISPHFAAGAVGVGRGAASFLATESTGTVLIPRLMTRIAGHALCPALCQKEKLRYVHLPHFGHFNHCFLCSVSRVLVGNLRVSKIWSEIWVRAQLFVKQRSLATHATFLTLDFLIIVSPCVV